MWITLLTTLYVHLYGGSSRLQVCSNMTQCLSWCHEWPIKSNLDRCINHSVTVTVMMMMMIDINNDINFNVWVAVCVAVADVVKTALNMTVWGLVRTLPSADSRSSNVDEYRSLNRCTCISEQWTYKMRTLLKFLRDINESGFLFLIVFFVEIRDYVCVQHLRTYVSQFRIYSIL